MKISILAFGIAKDIVGSSQFEIEIPKQTRAYDLKAILVEKFPEFGNLKAFQIAINAEYALDNMVVRDNDEIVIIPPVSGG